MRCNWSVDFAYIKENFLRWIIFDEELFNNRENVDVLPGHLKCIKRHRLQLFAKGTVEQCSLRHHRHARHQNGAENNNALFCCAVTANPSQENVDLLGLFNSQVSEGFPERCGIKFSSRSDASSEVQEVLH